MIATVTLRLLAVCASLAHGISFTASPLALAQREASSAVGHTQVLSANATRYFRALAEASSRRPVLVPPGDVRRAQGWHSAARRGSMLAVASGGMDQFQPSAEFQASADSDLPWGIGSPRTGDSPAVFETSSSKLLDVPKWVEYSLESGNNIQTFSTASQDISIITQVLENITNGFFLDTNGGDGEVGSNTLLLELTGWRGLIMEPRVYPFVNLWGKMRKAWLFLGCLSPNGNSTKIGFNGDGDIDMWSGHQIHAYPLKTFLEEMGGRKTIDFWALRTGGYEAEVLQETLLHSGSDLEIGVIMASFEGRSAGRGSQDFVQHRSGEQTERLIHEVMHNASYTYIGGLDPYWVNYVEPRYQFKDHVWVYAPYFVRRGLPVPTVIKSSRPPPLQYPRGDQFWLGQHGRENWPWDEGFTKKQEIDKMIAYLARAKADAAATEAHPRANRKAVNRIWDEHYVHPSHGR